jgi:hypothetical protein
MVAASNHLHVRCSPFATEASWRCTMSRCARLLDLAAAQHLVLEQRVSDAADGRIVGGDEQSHLPTQRGLIIARLEQVAVLIRDARVRYLPPWYCVPARSSLAFPAPPRSRPALAAGCTKSTMAFV